MPAGTTAFHGDLIRDLVVNNQVSGQLRVYLGIGGGFYAAPLLLAVSKAAALGVADFNGDGHDNIAVATTNGPFGSHRAFVLFGDDLGGFPSQVVFNLGRDQISLTIADFDNNGFPDVAIAAARNDRVYILLSNGVGGFSVTSFAAGPIRFNIRRGLATADFDLDGNADIAVPNEVVGVAPSSPHDPKLLRPGATRSRRSRHRERSADGR